jgi:PAS domain S-box-containing protein
METLTAPDQLPPAESMRPAPAGERVNTNQGARPGAFPIPPSAIQADRFYPVSSRLHWVVGALSAYALLGGVITLIGWFAGLPRATDWINSGIAMFANTAVAATCASLAIFAALTRRPSFQPAGRAFATIVTLIGALTLFEHLSGIDLGIDTLLVNPQWGQKAAMTPGRMGPPASVSFTLLGISLVLATGRSRLRRAVPPLAMVVVFISTLGVVGYLFAADPLFSIARFTGIAMQTASILLALALALLISIPDLQPVRIFREKSAAGVLARRALPFVALVPIVLGWLFILGRRAQLFDRGMGTALLVVALMTLLCTLLCWCVVAVSQHEYLSQASQARLQSLLSVMPAAVYTCDAEGQITFYNRRAVELWGREPEANGSSPRFCACYKVFLPDGTFVPPHQTPMAHAIRDGQSFRNVEAVVQRPDGSKFVAGVNIDPLRDSSGNVCGAINVFQDITPLKQAQDELRARQQQLQAIIENTPECVKLVRADGALLSMNGAGLAMIEADASTQVIGHCVYDVIAPEYRAAFQAMNERVCAGATAHLEFELVGLKGTRRWMETNAAPVVDPVSGERVQLAVTRDVTERRRVEAALRQSELLFRQLADTMPQIVWAARPDGCIDYYNKRWFEFTGFLDGSLGEDAWKSLFHPADLQRCVSAHFDCIRDELPYQVECRLKDRIHGGYRWFLARALPIRDDSGKVIRWFGTYTDIDDQKRAAEKLEQAVAERTASLQQVMTQMEEFSSSVSHDLRAPLRAIQSYVGILDNECRSLLPADAQDLLDKITRNSKRMDQLIKDVLALSRVAQADIRLLRIRPQPLIAEIIEQHSQMQPPHAEIEFDALAPVFGDAVSLRQAISNLLSNAVKFVPPGITPRVKIWTEDRGEMVRLWVEDNGIGINPEDQQKLFGMFQRLHPQDGYDGTGIGLAIVRKAVERMGGSVGVESDGKNGTQFWIELKHGSEHQTGECGVVG